MFVFQIIVMALNGLRANLLRSLLATLGVIIGVGAVIAAMSILEGSRRDIVGRIESLGSETITISPAFARSGGRIVGTMQTLTVEDADAIRDPRICPSVAQSAPQVSLAGMSVKYFSRNKQATVVGTNEAFAAMYNLKVEEGRFISREDCRSKDKVAVVGHKVAVDLFGGAPPIGQTIKIRSDSFRIVGLMEKKGDVGMGVNVDNYVFIPVTTAMGRLLGIRFIHMIVAQARSADLVDQAMSEIKRELRRRHNIRIRSGAKDDFQIASQEESRRQLNEITRIFAVVLYSIAGISLVVGGIGIMNIMLVSVTERTREIGVRMAVGAQRFDILGQFLIEAGVISLLGGGFGVLTGYMISDLIQNAVQGILKTYTPPSAVIWALTMAMLTGVVSGLYPAYKASRLDPVEALRYE
jgi:putative ABC transport system permease protein